VAVQNKCEGANRIHYVKPFDVTVRFDVRLLRGQWPTYRPL